MLGYLIISLYVFLVLAAATYFDIKTKTVDIRFLFGTLVPLILLISISGGNLFSGKRLLGLMFGILFVIVSYVSRGAIGLGDALMIAWIGTAFGIIECVRIVAISFGICFVTAIILTIFKKKKPIPFIPFLLIGYVINLNFLF